MSIPYPIYSPQKYGIMIPVEKIVSDLFMVLIKLVKDVTAKDVEQSFINHVNETIANDEEPRTLKNLCKDYSNMLENFGLYKTVKSDLIKDLLILHFGDTIGFHTRHQRNKRAFVYSRRTGQTYYEAVLNGLEVADVDILFIACNRLRINIKQDTRYYIPWPPNLNDLCNESKSESVMIRFLRNLTKTKLGSKNNAEICFLSECIHTLETTDKSQFQPAFSLLLHGLTRSKKLVNVASDLGVAILFHNVLYLHECWAREEFERQPCAQQK